MHAKQGHNQALFCADPDSSGRKLWTLERGCIAPCQCCLGSLGCWFPYMSLGQTRLKWLCANDCELEDMYQAVNHFSNLGPLHRLTISLSKTKVMFSVAPGNSGKQPKITISGLELKVPSDSPAFNNDRSSAFCWFFEQLLIVELIMQQGGTTCINKTNLFGGHWQDLWCWSILLQTKCQRARQACLPSSGPRACEA